MLTKHGLDIAPVEGRHRQMLADGQTAALLAIDGICAGLIGLADTLRPGASRAGQRITETDAEVAMITGDQATTAGALAACDNPPSRDREGADGAPSAPKQRFPDCCTIAHGCIVCRSGPQTRPD